jgi:hypothetical protein
MLNLIAESLLLATRLGTVDSRTRVHAQRREEDEEWLSSRRKARFDDRKR